MAVRGRRPGLVFAVSVLVLAVMGGVAVARNGFVQDDEATPRSDPQDLFVIGDSVTYIAAGSLQERFEGSRIQFVTRPGFTTADLLPLVRSAMATDDGPAASRGRVAVLVGYNDVRVRKLDTDALPAMVRETSRFRCAVWLTVPARPAGKPSRAEMVPSPLVDRWNERLAKETARYPNVHLAADWHDAVTSAPVGTLLEADGVHPNRAGQRRLADAYRAAIDRNC